MCSLQNLQLKIDSIVASIMMRRGRAVKLLVKRLTPVVEQRMKNKNEQGSKPVLDPVGELEYLAKTV
jgi:hypothetical protein